MTPGTRDWQPTSGRVPAPCEAHRYPVLKLSIGVSNELARRDGLRVVWHRRGATQTLNSDGQA